MQSTIQVDSRGCAQTATQRRRVGHVPISGPLHIGVKAATAAGAGLAAVWHSQTMMPPMTLCWPRWM
jgi:hypothetical protein